MSQNEKRLAANQKFRETWQVSKADGQTFVEKRISKECGKDTLDQIGKLLDQQINLAKKLTDTELKQIILFQEKEEKEKEIVYRRPYIEGETLAEWIQKGTFKPSEVIDLILKIGNVVSLAHVKGIVHGDLKPENIVISNGVSVCIIDWDTMKINKEINDTQHVTTTLGEIVGTPEYMAPEQCKAKKADEQSDVYSLGLILYAMIAGKTPFTGLNSLEIFSKKNSDIDVTSKYQDLKIDYSLAKAIENALKCDRNCRTKTVPEFLTEISRCNSSAPPVKSLVSNQEKKDLSAPVVNPQEETQEYNFILIGHSNAGKTVLAAALYSCASTQFSVEADSKQTRNYADRVKTLLQTHHWPDHTARDGNVNCFFRIYREHGKAASICFPEYAGEDVATPRYCDERLKNADAVVLLLNPSIMEIEPELLKKNPELKNDPDLLEKNNVKDRNERLSRLQEIITYLSRRPVVPPVALVITASDRLETDLKDKRKEFEEFADKIMISLNAKMIPSKRFDVSVTGKLESQGIPSLNPINVDAPFIWLLEQLDHRKKKAELQKKTRKVGIPVGIIFALILLIAFGVFFGRSKGEDEKEQKTIEVITIEKPEEKKEGDKKTEDNLSIEDVMAFNKLHNCIMNANIPLGEKAQKLYDFYHEHSDHPGIGQLEDCFCDEMYKKCKDLYSFPPGNLDLFITIQEICKSIRNVEMKGEYAKKWKGWCENYLAWKEKNSKYAITIPAKKILAKVEHINSDYYFDFLEISSNGIMIDKYSYPRWEAKKGTSFSTIKTEDKYGVVPLDKLPYSTNSFNLGCSICLKAKLKEKFKFKSDTTIDDINCLIFPGIGSYSMKDCPAVIKTRSKTNNGQTITVSNGKTFIQLTLSISPNTEWFDDWKKANPLPTRLPK